jgi:hypothetical protein
MQNYKSAIGGYLGLELQHDRSLYHDGCLALNTGRNSLEYLLENLNVTKIIIPFFSCDVILEPIQKLGIQYSFYHIDANFEPIIHKVEEKTAILYINYFGLCDSHIEKLIERYEFIIVDNSQAFFSNPLPSVHTFYSPRKFFGVPDGGFVTKVDVGKIVNYPIDSSVDRFAHLLLRAEENTEDGYPHYLKNELSLRNQEIKQMSPLTDALLRNVDFDYVKSRRKTNFLMLHDLCKSLNELNDFIESVRFDAPLVYPLLLKNGKELRASLIKQRIYTPQYWLNVLSWVSSNDWEFYLTENLVCLPIDQNVTVTDIERVASYITK